MFHNLLLISVWQICADITFLIWNSAWFCSLLCLQFLKEILIVVVLQKLLPQHCVLSAILEKKACSK